MANLTQNIFLPAEERVFAEIRKFFLSETLSKDADVAACLRGLWTIVP